MPYSFNEIVDIKHTHTIERMRENLLNENTQMFGLSTYNIYTNYTGLFTKRMQLEYT